MNDLPPLPDYVDDSVAYAPLRPGDERIVLGRCVIFLGMTPGPRDTVVARLRMTAGEVPQVVDEVRRVLRSRGRTRALWAASDAGPAGLADALRRLGMGPVPAPFTRCAVMVRAGEPPQVGMLPTNVRVTQVRTADDFRRAQEIYWTCFGQPPEAEAPLAQDFARLCGSDSWVRFLAWRVDAQGARAVAAADAVAMAQGVILVGGATLPAARGGGAYRALVWARWQLAEARGTPILWTEAGAESAPVLGRLGFAQTGMIDYFVDGAVAGDA